MKLIRHLDSRLTFLDDVRHVSTKSGSPFKTTAPSILVLSLLGADRLNPPTVLPDAATIAPDDIGLYAIGYAYRGRPERTFPIGCEAPGESIS